jgi:hypothetical protein
MTGVSQSKALPKAWFNSMLRDRPNAGGSTARGIPPTVIFRRIIDELKDSFNRWEVRSSDESTARIAYFNPDKAAHTEVALQILELSRSGRITLKPNFSPEFEEEGDYSTRRLSISRPQVILFLGQPLYLKPSDSLGRIIEKIQNIRSDHFHFDAGWDAPKKELHVSVSHFRDAKEDISDTFYVTVNWTLPGVQILEQLFNCKVMYEPPKDEMDPPKFKKEWTYPLKVWEVKECKKVRRVLGDKPQRTGENWNIDLATLKDVEDLPNEVSQVRIEFCWEPSRAQKCVNSKYRINHGGDLSSLSRILPINEFLHVEALEQTSPGKDVLLSVREDQEALIKKIEEIAAEFNQLKQFENDLEISRLRDNIYRILSSPYAFCPITLPNQLKLKDLMVDETSLFVCGMIATGFTTEHAGLVIPAGSKLTLGSEVLVLSEDCQVRASRGEEGLDAEVYFLQPILIEKIVAQASNCIKPYYLTLAHWGIHFGKEATELEDPIMSVDRMKLRKALSFYSLKVLFEMFFSPPNLECGFEGGYGVQIRKALDHAQVT